LIAAACKEGFRERISTKVKKSGEKAPLERAPLSEGEARSVRSDWPRVLPFKGGDETRRGEDWSLRGLKGGNVAVEVGASLIRRDTNAEGKRREGEGGESSREALSKGLPYCPKRSGGRRRAKVTIIVSGKEAAVEAIRWRKKTGERGHQVQRGFHRRRIFRSKGTAKTEEK